MTDHATARLNMVVNQLRPSRVTDPRLLAVMGSVPREAFVPDAMRGVAYADVEVPLGGGRYLVEPLTLARLIQAARLLPQHRVLVIGDATGYVAAVMAGLAARVTLLLPTGAAPAEVEARLAALGRHNVTLAAGEPLDGVPAGAPFDIILLVAGVESVPEPLLHQLADGGRLATVLLDRSGGKAALWTRVGDAFGYVTPFDAELPRLPNRPVAQGFEF